MSSEAFALKKTDRLVADVCELSAPFSSTLDVATISPPSFTCNSTLPVKVLPYAVLMFPKEWRVSPFFTANEFWQPVAPAEIDMSVGLMKKKSFNRMVYSWIVAI